MILSDRSWVISPHGEDDADLSGLADGVVELRLIRVMGPGDERGVERRFLAVGKEYRFAIHLVSDGVRVGRIHLRATDDKTVLGALGHAGYLVEEGHRRKGYAVRAIGLMAGLARRLGVRPLRVLIEPEIVASRRAFLRGGFKLVEEVETWAEARALGVGPRICRYTLEQ